MTARKKLYFVAPAIQVPIDAEESRRLTAWHRAQRGLRHRTLMRWAKSQGADLREPDSSLHSPHFGLLGLAAWLERDGHEVTYIDEEWLRRKGRWEQAWNDMVASGAAIFIGGITIHYEHVMQLIRDLKRSTGAIVIAGGHHATYREQDALDAGADLVIRGEGETAASCAAAQVVAGRHRWEEVPGATFRSGEELIRVPSVTLPTLNQLPDTQFGLLDTEQREKLDLYVFPSRGCRNTCVFCAEGRYWGGYRMLPPERVCDAITAHQRATPFNVVYLYDSTFGEDREQTLAFCNLFAERCPNTYLRTLTRLDVLDEELLRAMKAARIIEVLVGIESAGEVIRSRSGKCFANQVVYDKLEALREVVPLVKSSWLVGLPGETQESAQATIAMIKELHERELVVEASCRVVAYYPGSPCFEHPDCYGMRFTSYDWSRFARRARPVYELATMGSDEIYAYYCEAVQTETAAMEQRLVSFDETEPSP